MKSWKMHNPSLSRPGCTVWTGLMHIDLPDSVPAPTPPPPRLCLSVSLSANTSFAGWCGSLLPLQGTHPASHSSLLSCPTVLPSGLWLSRASRQPTGPTSVAAQTSNIAKPSRLPGAGPALHRRLRAIVSQQPSWASVSWGIPHLLSPLDPFSPFCQPLRPHRPHTGPAESQRGPSVPRSQLWNCPAKCLGLDG